MGSYVQASELGRYFPASRVIMLAGGNGNTETLSALQPATEQYLEERIANAEAEADARLQGRFALPVSPVPERLKLAVGKMTIFFLFNDLPELWSGGSNPKKADFDEQIDWLEGVKETDLFIGSAAVQASADILTTADDGEGGLVFGNGGLDAF